MRDTSELWAIEGGNLSESIFGLEPWTSHLAHLVHYPRPLDHTPGARTSNNLPYRICCKNIVNITLLKR